jgi:competence ComEA-like helix-hairpin-helix protein
MKSIDLNTASREDLMEIEGIDFILADNIIGYREEHGGIDRMDDLRDLSGMSESTLQELRAAVGESAEGGEEVEEAYESDTEEEEW